MTFYPLILQCRFPKNKDILLHNFCLVQLSNSRNLTLIQYYSYFSFVNCPNNKLKKLFPFSQGSHIALSCHVSLVFFNLEQFLAFLYPSWHWHFLCTQATFSFFFLFLLLSFSSSSTLRVLLILALSRVSSWLDSGYMCLAWIYLPELIIVSFSGYHM